MRGLSQTTSIIETYGKKKKGILSSMLSILQMIGMIIGAVLVMWYFGPVVGPMILGR